MICCDSLVTCRALHLDYGTVQVLYMQQLFFEARLHSNTDINPFRVSSPSSLNPPPHSSPPSALAYNSTPLSHEALSPHSNKRLILEIRFNFD
jgi:hypothetical protein